MKRILFLALTILLVAAVFAGCGSVPSNGAEGTYKVKTVDGKDLTTYYSEIWEATEDQLAEILETVKADNLEDLYVLRLNEGGKLTVSVLGQDASGTWELDGEEITFRYGDESQTGTYRNGEIVLDVDGEEMVLTR